MRCRRPLRAVGVRTHLGRRSTSVHAVTQASVASWVGVLPRAKVAKCAVAKTRARACDHKLRHARGMCFRVGLFVPRTSWRSGLPSAGREWAAAACRAAGAAACSARNLPLQDGWTAPVSPTTRRPQPAPQHTSLCCCNHVVGTSSVLCVFKWLRRRCQSEKGSCARGQPGTGQGWGPALGRDCAGSSPSRPAVVFCCLRRRPPLSGCGAGG